MGCGSSVARSQVSKTTRVKQVSGCVSIPAQMFLACDHSVILSKFPFSLNHWLERIELQQDTCPYGIERRHAPSIRDTATVPVLDRDYGNVPVPQGKWLVFKVLIHDPSLRLAGAVVRHRPVQFMSHRVSCWRLPRKYHHDVHVTMEVEAPPSGFSPPSVSQR